MSKEIINRAEEVLLEYATDSLARSYKKIENLKGKNLDCDTIAESLEDVNSYINFVCGDNEELYDKSRFRLFWNGYKSKWEIVAGIEINVDFRRKNEQTRY